MTANLPDFDTISDDFTFLDDWDERYRYLIDLGGHLPAFPEDERGGKTRVRGCASQVWLTFSQDGDQLEIKGDSDAAIVRGLIGLLLSLYAGKSRQDILAIDAVAELAKLDLQEHITPQRSNGVTSMIARIRAVASSAD